MLSTRHLLLTAVPTLALLLAAGPATAALDIVFGADAAGLPAGTGALPSGRTLVVSGPVLQLRLPGGGTVSLQQGAEFSVSEGPDGLTIDLVSGNLRASLGGSDRLTVRSTAAAVVVEPGSSATVTRVNGALSGRVYAGAVVGFANGESRRFASGQGFEVSESRAAGTFYPAAAQAPTAVAQASSPQGQATAADIPEPDTGGDDTGGDDTGGDDTGGDDPGGDDPGGDDTGGDDTGGDDTGGDDTGGDDTGGDDTGGDDTGGDDTGGDDTGGDDTGGDDTGGDDTGGDDTGGDDTGGDDTGGDDTGDGDPTTLAVIADTTPAGLAIAGPTNTTANASVVLSTAGNGALQMEELDWNLAGVLPYTLERNTAGHADAYDESIAGIGRWVGGTVLETSSTGTTERPLPGTDLSKTTGHDSLHYVWGVPAFNVPTLGTINYELKGWTTPTYVAASGAPAATVNGRFDGAFSIDLNGNAARFGFYHLRGLVTLEEGGTDIGYSFATPSGGVLLNKNQFNVSSSMKVTVHGAETGLACPGGTLTCSALTSLALFGDGGSHAGLLYTFMDSTQTSSSKATLTGAALFGDAESRDDPWFSGTPSSATWAVAFAGDHLGSQLQYNPTVSPGSMLTNGETINQFSGAREVGSSGSAGNVVRASSHAVESGSIESSGFTILTWNRWTNGSLFAPNPEANRERGPNEGVHVVAGLRSLSVPTTGTANYTLAGATSPTYGDGQTTPGTLTGGLAVDFGSKLVGLDLTASFSDHSYNFATSGGTDTPANGGMALVNENGAGTGNTPYFSGMLATTVTGSGIACPTGPCTTQVSGFLAGGAASHAGLSYQIGTGAISENRVYGAAAFSKD